MAPRNDAALARTQETQKGIAGYLKTPKVIQAIRASVPSHVTGEVLLQIAVTILTRSPQLGNCSPMSVINGVVEASQLGLSFEPALGQAYLVPFRNKHTGQQEATFIPGYRGLVHLAVNSGLVSSVSAEIVCKGDEFTMEYGTERRMRHIPDFDIDRADEKLWLGAYAAVRYKDGTTDFIYLAAKKINAVRRLSKAGESGPWADHTEEMWRKTAIRRLAKLMPVSTENMNFMRAVDREERRDLGLNIAPAITIEPELEEQVEGPRESAVEEKPAKQLDKEAEKPLTKNQQLDAATIVGDLKLDEADVRKAKEAAGWKGQWKDMPQSYFQAFIAELQKLGK